VPPGVKVQVLSAAPILENKIMTILSVIIIVFFGAWLYRDIVPTYRKMTVMFVDRAQELLKGTVRRVYILQPQEPGVISNDGYYASRFTPRLNFVLVYMLDGKLVLETAAWQKLAQWGVYAPNDIPDLNPNKRSIRIGAYTFLVLSINPDEFSEIMWKAKLPPPEIAVQYRQQLYDDIKAIK
jgi:hypothetical protein